MLASKIAYYARNSAGRIYPSLSLEQALATEHGLNGTPIVFPAQKKKKEKTAPSLSTRQLVSLQTCKFYSADREDPSK